MIVLTSGGFDPLHIGHLNYLEAAASYGRVIVALNSDEWIIQKKGYCFMPWEDRSRLLCALKVVERVVSNNDGKRTICDVLNDVKPDIFAWGGDRFSSGQEEHELCLKLGIVEHFGVGGTKIRSSSKMFMPIDKNNGSQTALS